MNKKTLILLIIIIAAIGVGGIYWWNQNQLKTLHNVSGQKRLYIPTGASYQQMLDSIQPLVKDFEAFTSLAKSKKLNKIYSGRYTFDSTTTNEEMVDRLLLGEQDEIEIMVGNYASIFELGEKLDPLLEITKDDIVNAITARPEAKGLDTLQMIYFLAPNTYRFHWTVSANDLIEKISQPLKKFWTNEKMDLLKRSGFTQMEAVTLASIVQMESYKVDEQPMVAGAYINRLKKGMKLQADPTVRFAKKAKEGWKLTSQRVYFKDLNIASAYNTYQNAGLPPGPICMPNPSAIEAVLNPAQHEYIFFVADTARTGYHLFAKSYAEHEKNAEAYRTWANNNQVK